MYYELALISVIVAGGYWGYYFVRHLHLRTYGLAQLAAALLCGLGLAGRKLDVPALGIAGAIGVGGGTCLIVLGPLVRALARRLAGAERFGIALRLLDIADVLAPGSGVAEEKAVLGAMLEIRDGKIDHVVDALTAAKDRERGDTRLAIDERIAMLYLTAYRWDDAIAHAEAHLFPAPPPAADGLRGALGLAPPVWVELLGAYAYKGDLDRAARMLARLEDASAGRTDAAFWVHRGRLIFLALAGRVGAVRTLVEPRRSRHMKPGARAYWLAVAHERHGDGAAAEAAYAKARTGARGGPRELIDRALARLQAVRGELPAAELGPDVLELVARVEAAAPPTLAPRARRRGPWMTYALAGSLVAVAATIAIALGDSTDVGVLMRAGACVRGLVRAGQWWRLVSCMFVHIGGAHLLVNAIGLLFIGRLAEEVFGPRRLLAIFAVTGLAGSCASVVATSSGISAGASGAIFGIVAAVFVELALRRKQDRSQWARAVWGSLAVVVVAQVGVGFLYPVTDQWAHGGGLVAGVALGAALSPRARWRKLGSRVALAIGAAFVVAVVVAGVAVARTSLADSLAAAPSVPVAIGGVTVTAPAAWQSTGDELVDPDVFIVLAVSSAPSYGPLEGAVGAYAAQEPDRAKARKFDEVAAATERTIALPEGWTGSELEVSFADPLGSRQRYRVVACGRMLGDTVVLASLYVPETIARTAPEAFTALLASVQLTGASR